MSSLMLQTAARVVKPLLLFVAVFLLLRGHHEPGGGFVGGLLAASAYVLHTIAFGTASARETLRLEPRTLMGAGLLLALATAIAPVLAELPFFTAGWTRLDVVSAMVEVGSPLLFDVGVFLVVLGVVTGIVLTLSED